VASVSLANRFGVQSDGYYWPAEAGVPPSDLEGSPEPPLPSAWAPAPSLQWDSDGTSLALSFSEPAAWQRSPWHLPATADGFYVPRWLQPSNRAWIGEGPVEWGASIDGIFQPARTVALAAGTRNSLHLGVAAADAAAAAPLDWTQPHTFRLHLLYQDVPPYQWWLWNGQFGILPARNYQDHYYFFPQDSFRARNFYDGYPSLEPVQPVLPPGYTSLDFGGLGPVQVPGESVGPGDHFSNVFDFELHQPPGVYAEIVSDPYTLTAPPSPAPIVVGVPGRTVTIIGDVVVGGTLTAVLS
jgi:hypothetical protein